MKLLICSDHKNCKIVDCYHRIEHAEEGNCDGNCEGIPTPCVSARKLKLKKIKLKTVS